MKPDFATYTKFYAAEDAAFLVTLLQQHQIPYALEHEVNQLDKVYIGDIIEATFALKIPPARFNEVNNILAEQAKADMDQPGFEHYLQTYSDTELQEILDDRASWSAYDLQVAKALLSKKTNSQVAVPVDDAVSYVPDKLDTVWIALGYITSIMGLTSFFFLGAAGFFSGLAIRHSKTTLKDGRTVFMYTKQDCMHGKYMMILSLICTLTGAVLFYIRH